MLAVFLDSLLSCLSLFKGSVLRWSMPPACVTSQSPLPVRWSENVWPVGLFLSQCEYGKSIYINGEACFCHYNYKRKSS